MKKPENYVLKKWLCSNVICGLKLHRYQTGCEDSATDWELESISGEKKRIKDSFVCYYVNLKPDWISVLRVNNDVIAEVKA